MASTMGFMGGVDKDGKRRSDHPSVTKAIDYELPVCIAIQVKISNITESQQKCGRTLFHVELMPFIS